MKELKIKYIDIVFENCESNRLLPNMFHSLIIEGITTSYWINCFQYKSGEVNPFINCDLFSIMINRNTCEKEALKRIERFNDITHIDLCFNDKTNKYITVPWGNAQYQNENQKTTITKKETMIIIKEKDKNDTFIPED